VPPDLRAVAEQILRSHGIAPDAAPTAELFLVLVPATEGGSPEAIARRLAEACDTKTALAQIHSQIRAVAQGTFDLRKENRQLQEENERLRGMQAHGLFDFVLAVEREDFLAFAVIMAVGNPNAARKFLEAPARTFYDRLERWKAGTKSHQRMLRWVQWRKAVGRKIKLPLPEGMADETAVNPAVLHEMVTAIGASSSRDYPDLLRQVLQLLLALNPENCERIRAELVTLLKEELPQ
jgi:hypothetical protein